MSKCSYLFVLAGCVGFYGGKWQTRRRKEKQEYLDYMGKRMSAEPVPCPHTLTEAELEQRKMQRVFIDGIPDCKNEIVVGPSPAPSSANISASDGYYVYTPITMKNGHTVLINRGWIQEDDALECPESSTPSESSSSKEYQRFYGLLTPPEFVPESIEPFDVASTFWPFLHRLAINTRWKDMIHIPPEQVPVVVSVTEPKPDNDIPVRLKERDFLNVKVTPDQHLSYVIFWYSIGAISWFYAYRFWKNPKAKRLFKRRWNRPKLSRSETLAQPERDLKWQ